MDTLIAAVPVAVPGAVPGEPLTDGAPRQYQFSADSPFAPAWADGPGGNAGSGMGAARGTPRQGFPRCKFWVLGSGFWV